MLKRFTDFTNIKNNATKQVVEELTIPTKQVDSSKDIINVPKIKEDIITPKIEESTNNASKIKDFIFNGKIAYFSNDIKPSAAISLLEHNKINKDKLHCIISKQSENTLVLLKYNEKSNHDILNFVNSLINHYKKNDNLIKMFENIIVSGTKDYTIIKNIPKVKINDKHLIDVFNDNIIKLLK